MIKQRTLIDKLPNKKYCILMSDQTVIIDYEWPAMKKARIKSKPIVEMLPCGVNKLSQERVLGILLEEIESNNKVYNKKSNR